MMKWICAVTAAAALAGAFESPCYAAEGASEKPQAGTVAAEALTSSPADGSTDFLSDDQWRRLPREERRRWHRASYIARYEPGGTPSPEKLDEYVQRFSDINIYDPRLAVFRVRAQRIAGTTGSVELDGEVSVVRYKSGIDSTLRDLGFDVVRNDIRVLPDAAIGPDIYGVVTTMSATMRREPRPAAEQVNSVAMGGWLRLLRVAEQPDIINVGRRGVPRPRMRAGSESTPTLEGLWFLAQSPEGYVGFVRDGEFRRTPRLQVPDGMLDVPTTVTLAGGGKLLAPAGASLVKTGKRAYLVGGIDARLPAGWKPARGSCPVFSAEEILSVSRPLMQTKYVWGGVTHLGIDCSGFTQFLCKTRGIWLPRDAEEQATVGQIVAFGTDVARDCLPGDLIFFMNEQGKVNHVAISLGGNRIIHSSGADVHLATLTEQTEEQPASLLDRALYARRVIAW